ncbi:hypothetical protein [Bradyrhizobium sp. 192]|uniref:hypothetical protein n=1 Tax=Bradyrhizobium sp. 192 TaxID=2782660 RepID=UPI001FFF8103|nr:hypothetical protein [Bradyrhizobium sp. 192]UPJ56239.1 hypothetical protein IVB24_26940 [Bradyrhizobium sp. 192]
MPALPPAFLSYAVLIEVSGTHGSGFFFSRGPDVFLVSAKHVLFKDSLTTFSTPLALTALDSKTLKDKIVFEVDCERLFADGNLIKHSSADVAVARIATMEDGEDATASHFRLKDVAGVQVDANNEGWSIMGTDIEESTKLDGVKIGSATLLLGFPTSLAAPEFFEKNTPLLRTGIVAGKVKEAQIVIDCPVYFGNSGGLVLQDDPDRSRFTAIGVASRMVPFQENLYSAEFRRQVGTRFENSGYSLVEPVDRVIELIDEVQRQFAHGPTSGLR